MGQTTSMPSPLPRASSNRNKTKQTFLHMLCHICQSISSHMQIMKEIEEVRLELKKKKKRTVKIALSVGICLNIILLIIENF